MQFNHQEHLPRHIGIIMDGNGRWARRRGLPRSKGHLEGLKAAKRVIAYLAGIPSIRYVTLYTFSTENWKRPKQEVSYLMGLISKYLLKELPFYQEHDIRVCHIGRRDNLPDTVLDLLDQTAELTREHHGLQVNLAVNYGSRDELFRAAKKLAELHSEGTRLDEISQEEFSSFLDTAGMDDPELILRSAGERRLSNFLLWQGAYAEYCFHPSCWPDWDEETVKACLLDYLERKRTFGGLNNE